MIKQGIRKANFTVEASLVMPIILVAIIMTIYLLIYMYDYLVCEVALYEGIESVFFQSSSCKNLDEIMKESMYEKLDGRIVGQKEIVVKTKIMGDLVYAEIGLETNLINPISLGMEDVFTTIKVHRRVKRISGAQIIRNAKRVEDIYELSKDYYQEINKEDSENVGN